uniref:Uncharacterized protein n=1 Tax=Candidatus Methanogaster sp. ANME-2c ERB4 TaxID=2759911 RepID=A0A7G9YLK3_9EURY|nr:hypothetical protein JFFFLBDL_00012 [Methanosarcinales archaeon ANME-2c ERB4]
MRGRSQRIILNFERVNFIEVEEPLGRCAERKGIFM